MSNVRKIKFNQNLVIDKTGKKKGSIKLKRISKNLGTDEIKVYYIKFEKGAKSKLHLHDSDQIIMGDEGKGILVTYSQIDLTGKNKANLKIEKSIQLNKGDVVIIPAGMLHWHGASKNYSSEQISVMKKGNTVWF